MKRVLAVSSLIVLALMTDSIASSRLLMLLKAPAVSGGGASTDAMLIESGSYLLLESSDKILLE